uniref:DUF150 domain-containing protein n=1 Tax=Ascaris lumbricoides TaxID=6252 RepID=A0A0M3IHV2_ASCLU
MENELNESVLDLCEFIGDELCEVLEKPGTHTVKELIDKANFNPKLKLPEPPCIAIICLTDFFGGEWEIDFFLEYRGQIVLHFKVPSNEKYLQVAAETADDDE